METVSINPFTSANQNSKFYWKRVKAAFGERQILDPYFKSLHHDCTDSGHVSPFFT
jgi:hypothetical protein